MAGLLRQKRLSSKRTSFPLLDLGELAADLFVGGPFLVIHFHEFPAHDSARVDDVSRRVGPAAAVRIKNAVAVDHFVIFVLQKRKIEFSFEPLAHHLREFLGVFVAVHADREDLDLLFLLFG
jgi:hypothetical protein